MLRTDVGGGWWEGEKNGSFGLFPESYARRQSISSAVVSDPSSDPPESVVSAEESESVGGPVGPFTASLYSADAVSSGTSEARSLPIMVRPGIAAGPRWLGDQSGFVVQIRTNPNKGSKFSGMKQFTTYDLESSGTHFVVQRRFKHFTWLVARLAESFACINIPPLPEKQLQGRFDEVFVERRRRGLQRFLNRVAAHPVLGPSSVFRHFLTATDQKVWKTGKRLAEQQGAAGFLSTLTISIDTPRTDL